MTKRLDQVYVSRTDLQPVSVLTIDGDTIEPHRGLVDLEDWARKYGYANIRAFGRFRARFRRGCSGSGVQRSAAGDHGASIGLRAELKDGAKFDFSRLSASGILIVDYGSREVLLARNSRSGHPIASITKLMTAMVSLDRKPSLGGTVRMAPEDNVGGASLTVSASEKFVTVDLFYAMIVGSANNAAHALARSTGPHHSGVRRRDEPQGGGSGTRFDGFRRPDRPLGRQRFHAHRHRRRSPSRLSTLLFHPQGRHHLSL